ncbi:MAG: MmcQ/YjbR family DNA-binding protein [Elusimicrobiota bacterium]
MALPEATEKEAWGAPTFRVNDRMFAMFVDNHHQDERLALWCNYPLDALRLAVAGDPGNFFVPPYVGKKGWLGVRLDRCLAWDIVAKIVRQAYLGTAPVRSKRKTVSPL